MTEILESTYEILKKIGSGGSGVVYLAEHLRLKKMVVVKVDKRRISAAPEAVAREMNILKNLSHTYIPHLYDYFQDEEHDCAYTVMDYIEGESLNNPLKRGERFSQAQVIQWACQLLDALDYLHTRKPHGYVHGDVKPSNIMVTPDGDIRLIDFNIGLALSEDNLVIGRTEGYASPEHYHYKFDDAETELIADDADKSSESASSIASASAHTSGPYEQPLDARSDIYSVGATLYHLLSGRRPAKRAEDVTPLKGDVASAPLIAIIQKAMAPDPKDRYQTAAEMRDALEQLPLLDPRAQRHRRMKMIAVVILSAIFLAGGFLAFVGLGQMGDIQKAYALSQNSAMALRNGDVDAAVSEANAALPESRGLFAVPPTPQAQRALANALGVYDITEGFKAHKLITLPSEPLRTALSPDGSVTAVLVEREARIFDTETGTELVEPLSAEYSALADIVFLDNDTLLYAGDGALTAYNIRERETVWETGNPVTGIALSADGSTVAGVYKDENLAVIYDAVTGETNRVVSFQDRRPNVVAESLLSDPGGHLFALDATGQWLAVSFQNGGLTLFDLWYSQNVVLLDTSPYGKFEGGFCGPFFAWSGAGEQGSVFSIYNLEEMSPAGSVNSGAPFHVQADESGIFVSNLQVNDGRPQSYAENVLTRMAPWSWQGSEIIRTDGSIASFVQEGERTLVVTSDQRCLAFDADGDAIATANNDSRIDFANMAGDYILTANRDAPYLRIQKFKRDSGARMFSYDPSYYHSEARVTPDSSTAVLFSYNNFRLISRNGDVFADVPIPDGADAYSIHYWKDDRNALDVRYNDGLVRSYSVTNGALISEEQGEAPDGSHDTVIVMEDGSKVDSDFHGQTVIYAQDGNVIADLTPEGYLYDAIQAGDYLITLYLTTDNDRYGFLLDKNGETLADLPRLTDALPNGTLIFDDGRGELYQSKIYSLEELKTLAKAYES